MFVEIFECSGLVQCSGYVVLCVGRLSKELQSEDKNITPLKLAWVYDEYQYRYLKFWNESVIIEGLTAE
jgi:hypothetical protein